MTRRSHAKCWRDDHYEHVCQQPSGHLCGEQPCDQTAGTDWGPFFCPDHDVERLDRISAGLREIQAALSGVGEDGD